MSYRVRTRLLIDFNAVCVVCDAVTCGVVCAMRRGGQLEKKNCLNRFFGNPAGVYEKPFFVGGETRLFSPA